MRTVILITRPNSTVFALNAGSKIPEGVVGVNIEPSTWVFSPEDDMHFDRYKLVRILL